MMIVVLLRRFVEIFLLSKVIEASDTDKAEDLFFFVQPVSTGSKSIKVDHVAELRIMTMTLFASCRTDINAWLIDLPLHKLLLKSNNNWHSHSSSCD